MLPYVATDAAGAMPLGPASVVMLRMGGGHMPVAVGVTDGVPVRLPVRDGVAVVVGVYDGVGVGWYD